ncbi:hypothetical protein Tco_0941658 [Tanacetum coccineum]|uniref:Uncharacterized protein n=1 Tax=Tanacetum coccineum TaxID=301880 RepID=A0ABQ5DT36_9ASTR
MQESVKEFGKQPKTVVISALEGVIQPPQETSVEILQARENLMKSIQTFLKKFNRISFKEMPKVLSLAWEKLSEIQHAFREKQHQPEDIQEFLHKLLKDLQIISEELADDINSLSWNCPAFYDDDDEYTIQYKEYLENSSNVVTPNLPTKEPDNSLSMGDEHLSTILETKLDELIKSSVENHIPIPSESEDFSDNESECDVPVCDDFTTFSNPLFEIDDDFSSSDDESFSDEDVPNENFKIYSNPLFDEEIISSKIDLHYFNVESDLIESLLYQDISMVSYPKIDSLLEEFSGELAHIDLIPPGINKADFDPEEEICLSSSPSLIPVEDSYSLMEKIDLFLDLDDSIPPGIESDDYDSEGDILFLEELLSNDSLSLPETESFHFDHYDVPSSPRPIGKPPDDGIFFDYEPDMGVLTAKVVEDISEHYILMTKLLPTHPTLYPDIVTLLPFSSENEDKVFNPAEVLDFQLVLLWRQNEVCLLCEGSSKPNHSLNLFVLFGANLKPLKILRERRGIANMTLCSWGVSRVDEMILPRVSEVLQERGRGHQVVPGFLLGRERRLMGKYAVLSPQVV